MSTPLRSEVTIRAGGIELAGMLDVPAGAVGLVVFAHGSGSSRHSPRNQRVAELLRRRGFATLLFDLLTAEEERVDALDATLRFDVDLLAERLVAATDWIHARAGQADLPIAYFGASTGAAAALIAAARRPALIAAVVARGGRPDLAGDRVLRAVRAPTLLVVGGADRHVRTLNADAAAVLGAPVRLAIVPGAGHLFEEPGALDEVARLAGDWLIAHVALPAAAPRAGRRGGAAKEAP
jgi:pimeloyl-ACP methyl ester carboxylesterase